MTSIFLFILPCRPIRVIRHWLANTVRGLSASGMFHLQCKCLLTWCLFSIFSLVLSVVRWFYLIGSETDAHNIEIKYRKPEWDRTVFRMARLIIPWYFVSWATSILLMRRKYGGLAACWLVTVEFQEPKGFLSIAYKWDCLVHLEANSISRRQP